MEHQPETEHQQEVEAGQASGSSGSEKAIALHPGSSVNDPEAPATSGQLVIRHLCGLLVSAGKPRPSCTPPAPPPTRPLAPLVENPIKKEKNKMRQTNEAQKRPTSDKDAKCTNILQYELEIVKSLEAVKRPKNS
ncbi:hypothetical protein OUZ56_017001 [Daphnia magna]|uniref:Uncharacterized protein n=1 Tax=Daphnia magna TaxID=35525 RepID=A0ABR0ARY6_9CRUS|nr:hypothetical protein OUZ56_017001 [Daphnia magna]